MYGCLLHTSIQVELYIHCEWLLYLPAWNSGDYSKWEKTDGRGRFFSLQIFLSMRIFRISAKWRARAFFFSLDQGDEKGKFSLEPFNTKISSASSSSSASYLLFAKPSQKRWVSGLTWKSLFQLQLSTYNVVIPTYALNNVTLRWVYVYLAKDPKRWACEQGEALLSFYDCYWGKS